MTRQDCIELTGLRATGFHGLLEHERATGQEFLVDIRFGVNTREAAAADDLEATVDYARVAQAAHDVMTGPPVNLIETLADRIAKAALAVAADSPAAAVEGVWVRVHKPQAPIAVPFGDVTVCVHRRAVLPVVLALGSNVGDRLENLRFAVRQLGALPGLRLTAVSPLVETEPVGGPPQGDYLNAVVLGECELSPWRLLPACQRIESAAGRQRRERWGPRTLDIDIIDVGNRRQDHPRLQLPHPRAGERAFVLVPWSLAAPDATLAGRPVAELRELAPDRGGVRVWQGDPDWVAAE